MQVLLTYPTCPSSWVFDLSLFVGVCAPGRLFRAGGTKRRAPHSPSRVRVFLGESIAWPFNNDIGTADNERAALRRGKGGDVLG